MADSLCHIHYRSLGLFNTSSTKIARSRDIGVLASGKCCQDVINGDKATSLCFESLDKNHKCYKSCFFRPRVSITPSNALMHARFIAHARTGKGRRVYTLEGTLYTSGRWVYMCSRELQYHWCGEK